MNMAELLWKQGRAPAALAHFRECRDLFFALLVRPDGLFALFAGPRHYTRSARALVARMVRFVLSLGAALLAENRALLDLLLHMEALAEAGGRGPVCTVDVWRVWALLHQLRSSSRGLLASSTARKPHLPFSQDEVLRQNIAVLRQIHLISSRPAANLPAPSPSPRRAPPQQRPAEDVKERECALEPDLGQRKEKERELGLSGWGESGRWDPAGGGSKVYALQVTSSVIALYSRVTGRVEVRQLGGGDKVSPAIGAETLDGVKQMLLDETETVKRKEHPSVSSSLAHSGLGRMLHAVLGLNSSGGSCGGDNTPQSCSEGSRPSDDLEPSHAKLEALASKRSGWFSNLSGLSSRFNRAKQLAKFAPCTDDGPLTEAPLFLACSSILRSLPWELALPSSLPVVRVVECRALPQVPSTRQQGAGSAEKERHSKGRRSPFVSLHQAAESRREQLHTQGERSAQVEAWRNALLNGELLAPAASSHADKTGALCSQLRQKRSLSGMHLKYPCITFLEAAHLAASPESIVPLLEHVASDPLILLVPFHGILRIPQALTIALANRPGCTLAFCPQSSIKRLVRTIDALLSPPKPTTSTKLPTPNPSSPSPPPLPEDPRSVLLRACRCVRDKFGVLVLVLTAAPYSRHAFSFPSHPSLNPSPRNPNARPVIPEDALPYSGLKRGIGCSPASTPRAGISEEVSDAPVKLLSGLLELETLNKELAQGSQKKKSRCSPQVLCADSEQSGEGTCAAGGGPHSGSEHLPTGSVGESAVHPMPMEPSNTHLLQRFAILVPAASPGAVSPFAASPPPASPAAASPAATSPPAVASPAAAAPEVPAAPGSAASASPASAAVDGGPLSPISQLNVSAEYTGIHPLEVEGGTTNRGLRHRGPHGVRGERGTLRRRQRRSPSRTLSPPYGPEHSSTSMSSFHQAASSPSSPEDADEASDQCPLFSQRDRGADAGGEQSQSDHESWSSTSWNWTDRSQPWSQGQEQRRQEQIVAVGSSANLDAACSLASTLQGFSAPTAEGRLTMAKACGGSEPRDVPQGRSQGEGAESSEGEKVADDESGLEIARLRGDGAGSAPDVLNGPTSSEPRATSLGDLPQPRAETFILASGTDGTEEAGGGQAEVATNVEPGPPCLHIPEMEEGETNRGGNEQDHSENSQFGEVEAFNRPDDDLGEAAARPVICVHLQSSEGENWDDSDDGFVTEDEALGHIHGESHVEKRQGEEWSGTGVTGDEAREGEQSSDAFAGEAEQGGQEERLQVPDGHSCPELSPSGAVTVGRSASLTDIDPNKASSCAQESTLVVMDPSTGPWAKAGSPGLLVDPSPDHFVEKTPNAEPADQIAVHATYDGENGSGCQSVQATKDADDVWHSKLSSERTDPLVIGFVEPRGSHGVRQRSVQLFEEESMNIGRDVMVWARKGMQRSRSMSDLLPPEVSTELGAHADRAGGAPQNHFYFLIGAHSDGHHTPRIIHDEKNQAEPPEVGEASQQLSVSDHVMQPGNELPDIDSTSTSWTTGSDDLQTTAQSVKARACAALLRMSATRNKLSNSEKSFQVRTDKDAQALPPPPTADGSDLLHAPEGVELHRNLSTVLHKEKNSSPGPVLFSSRLSPGSSARLCSETDSSKEQTAPPG